MELCALFLLSSVVAVTAGAQCTSVTCRSTGTAQTISNTTEQDTIRSIQCTLRCAENVIYFYLPALSENHINSFFSPPFSHATRRHTWDDAVWTDEPGTHRGHIILLIRVHVLIICI